MTVHPILSALLRNKTGPALVALQIALALALAVNAVYVSVQRLEVASRPTGLNTADTFWVSTRAYSRDLSFSSMVRSDLLLLRSMPGVVAATMISDIPLRASVNNTMFLYGARPGIPSKQNLAFIYLIDEQGVTALGAKLVAGHAFDPATVLPATDEKLSNAFFNTLPPEAIITRAFAKDLFPDASSALGKVIYGAQDRPFRIVGVIDTMLGPWPLAPKNEQIVLSPAATPGPDAYYLVRTRPGRRDELMRQAEDVLTTAQTGRVVNRVEALDETAARNTYGLRHIATVLVIVVAVVLSVTALGVYGLATFNVTMRTKQIGTRRAVGARRFHIIRQFMAENWIITSVGVILGSLLALAINAKLAPMIRSPRLPLYYLVGGIVALWILGLVATLRPARRAAAVSPAVATRTV
jgi:putative ABC transport system permease protein